LTALCLELSADAFGERSVHYAYFASREHCCNKSMQQTSHTGKRQLPVYPHCCGDLISQVATVQSASKHSKQTEQVCRFFSAVQTLKMQSPRTQDRGAAQFVEHHS